MVDISYNAFTEDLAKIHFGEGDFTCLVTNDGSVITSKGAKESPEIVNRPFVNMADSKIREQSLMVGQTAELFSKINGSIEVLTDNIGSMEDIITDMDKYKEKVMSSMENMSAVSQQTSASAEEVSAATEEQLASAEELVITAQQLNELSKNLVTALERFKV